MSDEHDYATEEPLDRERWQRSAKRALARQADSMGDTVSGYGEHGLANGLWAFAARMREEGRREI